MNTNRKIFLILATICVAISAVIYLEKPNIVVFWNDLHSGDTLSMYEFGKYNLQHGDLYSGIRYLYFSSLRAIEFRKHQQAAEPIIEEYSRSYQQGDYQNALIACEKARSVLDGYDDEGVIAFECAKTEEQLLNQLQNH